MSGTNLKTELVCLIKNVFICFHKSLHVFEQRFMATIGLK